MLFQVSISLKFCFLPIKKLINYKKIIFGTFLMNAEQCKCGFNLLHFFSTCDYQLNYHPQSCRYITNHDFNFQISIYYSFSDNSTNEQSDNSELVSWNHLWKEREKCTRSESGCVLMHVGWNISKNIIIFCSVQWV